MRSTGEVVEVIAHNTEFYGKRSINDWVSYIDSNKVEHEREHLNLEWDFKINDEEDLETPDEMMNNAVLLAFRELLPIYKDYKPTVVASLSLDYAEGLIDEFRKRNDGRNRETKS